MNALDAAAVLKLASQKPGLLTVFVQSRPRLAAEPELWNVDSAMQREILEALLNTEGSPELHEEVVRGMLNAGKGEMASLAYRRLGADVVHICLSWLDTQRGDCMPLAWGWRRLVQQSPTECIAWLRKHRRPGLRTLAAIVPGLDPASSGLDEFKTDYWSAAVASNRQTLETEETFALADFLLALAFARRDPETVDLFVFAFDPVHTALARNALPYDSWLRTLRVSAPSVLLPLLGPL